MRLYTNDLDQGINENYVPQESDILTPHKIVTSEFRRRRPLKISEMPISSQALVDFEPNEETAKRYNQSWLGIGTRKSGDESAPIFNYRFFGDDVRKTFMEDLGVASIDELVGKEVVQVKRKDGKILGYSPKQE
jgi:hypothetical protein